MNTLMKKVLAMCIVASLSAVTFGCGGNKTDSTAPTTPSVEIDTNNPLLKNDLTFTFPDAPSADQQDATEAPVDSQAGVSSETEVVTEVVTEYVPVTEAGGQEVTDEQGVVETEVVTEIVTEYVEVTEGDNNNSSSNYTPSYDTCKAFWFDTSQMKDFVFEGEFLVIDFQINETTPDGNYPVTISKTDIGSWDLVSQVPTLIDGEVCVGNAQPSTQATAGDEFTLTVDQVSGKPGDIVTVAIDLANNPGFVGFIIDIQYDKNALTVVDSRGGADFDAVVNYVE